MIWGMIKMLEFKEILKLDKLLNKSLIPYTFIEKDKGFQILYPEKEKPTKYSIIETPYSYGNENDKLEIMGLNYNCKGGFSAEQILNILMKEHYKPVMYLPIKEKWFSMILNEEKLEEYREIKPFYEKRIKNILGNKKWQDLIKGEIVYFGKVFFRNGYSSSSPHFISECSLKIGEGKTEWGAEKDKKYFIFIIHNFREIKNEN